MHLFPFLFLDVVLYVSCVRRSASKDDGFVGGILHSNILRG